jgi:hypothetical protein
MVPDRLLRRVTRLLQTGDDKELSEHYRSLRRNGFDKARALDAVIRSRYSMPKPDAPVLIKDNPAYYLIDDAGSMLRLSSRAHRRGDAYAEARYARCAVIGFSLGLEAYINFVYLYTDSRTRRSLKNLSARDKWLQASLECMPPQGHFQLGKRVRYRPGDHVRTFSGTSRLFETYMEVKQIRNDMTHMYASVRSTTASALRENLRRRDAYPLTRIPKDIGRWRVFHAKRVEELFWRLLRQLDVFMRGSTRHLLDAPQFVEFIYGESM